MMFNCILPPAIIAGCLSCCQDEELSSCPMAVDNFHSNYLKIAQLLDGKNDKYLQNLNVLHEACKDFQNFATEYDFDEHTPYNGYRSFVKLVAIYFDNIVRLSEATPSRKKIKQLNEYEQILDVLLTFYRFLLLVRNRKLELDGSDFDDTGYTEMHPLLLSLEAREVKPLYTSIKNFWLCPSMRKFLRTCYLPMILVKLLPFNLFMKAAVSSDIRTKIYTQFALNASLQDVQTLWNAGEDTLNRSIIKGKNLLRGTVRAVKFERQKNWILDYEGKLTKTESIESKDKKKSRIKCLYIHYERRGSSPNNSLIFHCHGGGFISMTPRGHEGYLRKWSRKVGVPVLSVFYRLAPQHPYPSALQDCLDAYLAVVSGNSEAEQLLGYHPKNIVICGDSAGANLSLALSYVLNDIRKQAAPELIMPKSLCIQYPVSNPILGCTAAARGLVCFDSILSIGPAYACCAGLFAIEKDNDVSIMNDKKPWYRQEKDKVQEVIRENLRSHLRDAYINILAYQRFEELLLPLKVQACEFDPLLDDSIAICRKWKGPVTLDIVEGMPHGFLSFQDFSLEARQAGNLSAKRITEALDISRS